MPANSSPPTFGAARDYDMVRFLERVGCDVTYATNIDVHENGNLLLPHNGFLSTGHDEYWSFPMRSNVTMARDCGVNLGFFAANTCYWQIRMEASTMNGAPDRTIVSYKQSALTQDPFALSTDTSEKQLVTTEWRTAPVNMPEAELIGVMSNEALPLVGPGIVIEDAASWGFASTELQTGSAIPGILGYEVDEMFPSSPPGTVRLAHSPYKDSAGNLHFSDMTVYTTSAGTTVFATGTIRWSWDLDGYVSPGVTRQINPAVQQITRNVLARFGAFPGSP